MKKITKKTTKKKDPSSITLRWSDHFVGLPNAFLRSALFSTGRGRGDINEGRGGIVSAEEGNRVTIKATSDISVTASMGGGRLNQYDKLVFSSLIHLCWLHDIDKDGCKATKFQFRISDGLKILGIEPSTATARVYLASLERLSQTTIIIDHLVGRYKAHFSGSLLSYSSIHRGRAAGSVINININESLQPLFQAGMWSALDWQIMQSLGRNYLAHWIYSFFSSHNAGRGSTMRKVCPALKCDIYDLQFYSLYKLQSLCGTDIKERWKFKQKLNEAIAKIKAACDAANVDMEYEFRRGKSGDEQLRLGFTPRPRGKIVFSPPVPVTASTITLEEDEERHKAAEDLRRKWDEAFGDREEDEDEEERDDTYDYYDD
ncbi:MAG: hypothetical protein Q4D58_06965 [Synergistaceae bacterium]|nr:hypothetical protein [Synergistaceae bacterium]